MSYSPLINFVVTYQESLRQVDLLRELWMIPERLFAQTKENDNHYFLETLSPLYRGKLFVWNKEFHALETWERVDDRSTDTKRYYVQGVATGIKYDANEKLPLCTPQDPFNLQPGSLANYPQGQPLDTTLGIFVANYQYFVYPFGDKIAYLNETFTASKMEKRIGDKLLNDEISVRDVKDKYVNALSLIGQATEIIAKGISEKTINIPKSIGQLRERLVAENREALAAGDASVMTDIEKQLIAAYKKHLEGDSSLHFLLKAKYFNVALKKLLLTQGMTEVFGSPGKFEFVENPMGNGWKQKDLPLIFNEVRSGSFSRAIETADGGVIAKLILRVYQDARIDIDDCGTTRGGLIHGTEDTVGEFLWNYVVNKDGTTTAITPDNKSSFVGRELTIRTPGFCQATQGYCSKCFGFTFEQLKQKAFAPIANDFARNQTTAALKKMHGSSHNTVDVSDISRYLI